jgi:hypothetical protein
LITTHIFYLGAKCPTNGDPDRYLVTITTREIIVVEKVVAHAEMLAGENLYQEQITERLSEEFCFRVETQGFHMRGRVVTTCEAGEI